MATLTFYGGVNEIGGNKILLEDSGTRLLLDFGVSFRRMGDFYEEFLKHRPNNALRDLLALGILPPLPGVYREDLLRLRERTRVAAEAGAPDTHLWETDLPSYDDYLAKHGHPFVDALLISHAHADHFQHIPFLDERIPVYCSQMTSTLIQSAEDMGRGGIDQELFNVKKDSLDALGKRAFFPGALTLKSADAPRTFIPLERQAVRIGAFTVQAIPVDHSVLGAVAYLITTSSGTRLLYTGDLRFHGRRSDWTSAFWETVRSTPIDLLITEGTRIDKEEQDNEEKVEQECQRIVQEANAKGVLVLASFAWKDTTRYQTFKQVAERTGRTLVVSPKLAYAIERLKDVPDSRLRSVTDEPNVRVYLKRIHNLLYSPGDYVSAKHQLGYSANWDRKDPSSVRKEHYETGVRAYHILQEPAKYLLHLDYFELSELIDLQPPSGSIYIRAMSEPFNEEMHLDEQRLINWLRQFNINPPDHQPLYVHASGHASGPELRRLIETIKPKAVFPIHTVCPAAFGQDLPPGVQIQPPEVGVPYEI